MVKRDLNCLRCNRTDEVKYLWYYHLFGLFWVGCFLLALAQFILAVAAATWYFSHSDGESGTGKVWYQIKLKQT